MKYQYRKLNPVEYNSILSCLAEAIEGMEINEKLIPAILEDRDSLVRRFKGIITQKSMRDCQYLRYKADDPKDVARSLYDHYPDALNSNGVRRYVDQLASIARPCSGELIVKKLRVNGEQNINQLKAIAQYNGCRALTPYETLVALRGIDRTLDLVMYSPMLLCWPNPRNLGCESGEGYLLLSQYNLGFEPTFSERSILCALKS